MTKTNLAGQIDSDRRRKLTPKQFRELEAEAVAADETQERIARKFGVSQGYVSTVRRDANHLLDMLEALGVDESELLMTEPRSADEWESAHIISTLLETDRRLRKSGYAVAGTSL
jgi:transcriptional regulator with XRE-family HTH domain